MSASASIFNLPYRIPNRTTSRKSSPGQADKSKGGDSPSSRARNVSQSSRTSRTSRKRKLSSRDGEASEDDTSSLSDVEANADPWTRCAPAEAKMHMPVEMVEQYDVAGLKYHEPLPRGHFPHASYEARKTGHRHRRSTALTKDKIRRSLAGINPPAIGFSRDDTDIHRPSVETTSLKQNSTATLIAILHRCIQSGDYERAERAFAILLRLRVGNHELDLRKDGFWGFGAELLMHRGRPRRPKPMAQVSIPVAAAKHLSRSRSRPRSQSSTGRSGFGPKGSQTESEMFREHEAARQRWKQWKEEDARLPMPTAAAMKSVREYYNLLIVQYPPSNHTHPGSASAVDFYLAMYGVWIAHIDDTRRIAERNVRRRLGVDTAEESEEDEDDDAKVSMDRYANTTNLDEQTQKVLANALQQVRESQLAEATEISKHMENAISSFPFSDDVRLVRLRGMVEHWIADLHRPWSDFVDSSSNSIEAAESGTDLEVDDSANLESDESTSAEERLQRLDLGSDQDKEMSMSESGEEDDNEDGDDVNANDENSMSLKSRRIERARHLKKAMTLLKRADELERTAHLRQL